MMGWSLGGYYAPRAAAYEKRLALCVAWGANHNWVRVQQRRLAHRRCSPGCRIIGSMSCGSGAIKTWTSSCVSFPKVSLTGHLNRITVPFLITMERTISDTP